MQTSRRCFSSGIKQALLKARRINNMESIPSFSEFVSHIPRKKPETVVLTLGLYCNQQCNHCHVESSPKRTEMMDLQGVNRLLHVMENTPSVTTLDITGGAPELQEHFRYLVTEARKLGLNIVDRCNLTCLFEPQQEDLADFLAENQIKIIASLPCYTKKTVNLQRGAGVFDLSIRGLQKLNSKGYGHPNTGLELNLVYNPAGERLAPPASALEDKYREELMNNFDIVFTKLSCLNNMPVKRFADFLSRRGKLESYMKLLVDNFSTESTENLMCSDTINIGWDGRIFDCNFNEQMDTDGDFALGSIWDVEDLIIVDKEVITGKHCFGCTAGNGSR